MRTWGRNESGGSEIALGRVFLRGPLARGERRERGASIDVADSGIVRLTRKMQ